MRGEEEVCFTVTAIHELCQNFRTASGRELRSSWRSNKSICCCSRKSGDEQVGKKRPTGCLVCTFCNNNNFCFWNINIGDISFPKWGWSSIFWNESLHLLLEFPFEWPTWKGSLSASEAPFDCSCLYLFSLSLKCCLTVPIYDNRLLSVYRNNCTVTRRAESRSLRQPVAFSQAFFFLSLYKKEKSQGHLLTG